MDIAEQAEIAILAVLLLSGCWDPESGELDFVLTAQGYYVAFMDQGSISSGLLALEDVHAIHAQAVADAVALDPALGEVARKVHYVVRDCHSFPVGDVWAVGVYRTGLHRVEVALWSQGVGPEVPPDAPSWTVRSSIRDPSLYVWGVGPPWCPALAHELGHAAYGPQYGH